MPPKKSTRQNSIVNSHVETESHGHSHTMGETRAPGGGHILEGQNILGGGHIPGGENPLGGGHVLGGENIPVGGAQQMALMFEMIKGMQQAQVELAESLKQLKRPIATKKTTKTRMITATTKRGSFTTEMMHHLSLLDCRTLRWEVNRKIQDDTLQLSEEQQRVHKMPFPNYKKDKNKAVVSVVIHGNTSDMEVDESAALGFGLEDRNAAPEALITIAAESEATCFTAEVHASHAFLETTNAIIFTDEDMEVQHPDHRRPLYLSAVVKDVQVRRALVDTGSCLNLIPLSTLQVANVSQQKIQGSPMEVIGFGRVTEYTMGHVQLVLRLSFTENPSIVKLCGTPLPDWEDIKNDPEVDLQKLLEWKKKRKESEVAHRSLSQCGTTLEESGLQPSCHLTQQTENSKEVMMNQAESTAVKTEKSTIAKPKVTTKEELEMPRIDPRLVAHSLNVEPGTRPVVQPMRTFHIEMEAQITQEVKNLLAAGFIKPIQHPRWLSNIVPAAGHAMFSFMDGFSGYNQIRMSTKDAEKTAFRTPIDNFYYTVMPFGLKNIGATYQRTMTAVFYDMIHQEIENYVDDIVVKSKRREDHLETLRKVFERCHLYKLKMNPLKWAFGVSAGKFLGFLVHNRGINVDLAKASAIATLKAPTSHKKLKSFLGRLSYIRRFIPSLAAVTAVFTPLMKKRVPFVWSTTCQQAFEKIQTIMTKLPTVCALVTGRPLRLYLASNGEAIGALVAQKDEGGTEKLVYYVSRALRDTKTSGAGIVLIREDGETIAKSFKLDFSYSNNASEYEAYITELAIAHEMGIRHLKVIEDSNLIICQAKGEFSPMKHGYVSGYRYGMAVLQFLKN
uniref:Reverse transcriptase domain-containing protein n=1 Tax=Fagus sylvatica TaxID=28930 RepID=A0A2N9ETB6_FAGSY